MVLEAYYLRVFLTRHFYFDKEEPYLPTQERDNRKIATSDLVKKPQLLPLRFGLGLGFGVLLVLFFLLTLTFSENSMHRSVPLASSLVNVWLGL